MFAKLFSRQEPSPEEAAYRRLVRKGYQPRAIVGGGPLMAPALGPGEVDPTMELDGPAFLRRQNE